MRNKFVIVFTIQFVLFVSLYNISFANDEQPTDDLLPQSIEADLERTRSLLQKGLNLHEMDQEIARLADKEVLLSIEIETIEHDIPIQQKQVQETKARAAKVLKSYYLGERDSLFLALFSLENFSEALAAIEFVSQILNSDRKKLNEYYTSFIQLEALRDELIASQMSLQEIKQQFIAQRNALLALQEELDLELERHEEAAKIIEQINALTTSWQEKGLPVFRHYLQALADAMANLPNIQSMFNNIISLRGTSIQFQITADQLNQFLVSEDPIFEHLTFQFNDDDIVAEGQHDDMHVTIKGHFDLELTPINVMRYHIDELLYNNFVLPESTNRSLEEQFSFGFYPEEMSFFGLTLQATELHMESGSMRVMLKFK